MDVELIEPVAIRVGAAILLLLLLLYNVLELLELLQVEAVLGQTVGALEEHPVGAHLLESFLLLVQTEPALGEVASLKVAGPLVLPLRLQQGVDGVHRSSPEGILQVHRQIGDADLAVPDLVLDLVVRLRVPHLLLQLMLLLVLLF